MGNDAAVIDREKRHRLVKTMYKCPDMKLVVEAMERTGNEVIASMIYASYVREGKPDEMIEVDTLKKYQLPYLRKVHISFAKLSLYKLVQQLSQATCGLEVLKLEHVQIPEDELKSKMLRRVLRPDRKGSSESKIRSKKQRRMVANCRDPSSLEAEYLKAHIQPGECYMDKSLQHEVRSTILQVDLPKLRRFLLHISLPAHTKKLELLAFLRSCDPERWLLCCMEKLVESTIQVNGVVLLERIRAGEKLLTLLPFESTERNIHNEGGRKLERSRSCHLSILKKLKTLIKIPTYGNASARMTELENFTHLIAILRQNAIVTDDESEAMLRQVFLITFL